ncbi:MULTISPECIES: hypothetical protein [unclassified Streptomyces]|uniref:hypothetical protein n=1 Tax=unclassified Streptomyces TaxID=2593676 RepID=UPI0011C41DEE|nr:hypothetical protein [Streptomyces sp. LaPpAH-202]MYW62078.1 hypothetical protein [Streptomyces sp. SID8370]MYW84699.1 hypothetical protein [Streptomyces sp. SID8371]
MSEAGIKIEKLQADLHRVQGELDETRDRILRAYEAANSKVVELKRSLDSSDPTHVLRTAEVMAFNAVSETLVLILDPERSIKSIT